EEAAIGQLKNLAQMPFVYKHVAAMPDTHYGIGATVGSVFASIGAVIPAAVGVDIGCGMIAAKTNLKYRDIVGDVGSKPLIRSRIEKAVPMGRTNNGGQGDRGAWGSCPQDVIDLWNKTL